MDINKIAQMLEINIPKENISINEPMSKHTTFKIGGNADIFVQANNLAEIKYILDISKNNSIPLTIIGNGSNVLVKDNGIRGIVLKIKMQSYKIVKNKEEALVDVEAGMLNSRLAQIFLKESIEGFEFASGIPGTIGGAIRMNAGAYGSEMKDIVEETTYIDLEDKNKIKTINNDEQCFKYRHSIFQDKSTIIISTKLKLKHGNKDEIANQMNENLQSRKEKQPLDKPNAGSTFKRGKDFITAQLIDKCGLKGAKIGGAEVSTKHAGFIVNTGNATANDVINLINKVKSDVYSKFNENIDLEIEIIGE